MNHARAGGLPLIGLVQVCWYRSVEVRYQYEPPSFTTGTVPCRTTSSSSPTGCRRAQSTSRGFFSGTTPSSQVGLGPRAATGSLTTPGDRSLLRSVRRCPVLAARHRLRALVIRRAPGSAFERPLRRLAAPGALAPLRPPSPCWRSRRHGDPIRGMLRSGSPPAA